MYRLTISIFILFYACLFAIGQTGKHNSSHYGMTFYNKFESDQLLWQFNDTLEGVQYYTQSSYSGDLLFRLSNSKIYYNKNNELTRAGGKNSGDGSHVLSMFSSCMKINDSTFLLADWCIPRNNSNNVQMLYHTLIATKDRIEMIEIDKEFDNLNFNERNVNRYTVSVEDTLGGHWVIARLTLDTFVSYYFKEGCYGCIKKISTIPINTTNLKRSPSDWFNVSPSGNILIECSNNIQGESLILLYKIIEVAN